MVVEVWGESMLEPLSPRRPITTGLFTFVAIDEKGVPQPITPLRLDSEQDRDLFEEGKIRYEASKAKRSAKS